MLEPPAHKRRHTTRHRKRMAPGTGFLLVLGAVLWASAAFAEESFLLLEGGEQTGALVVTHAGAGSPPEFGDGAQRAADTGWRILHQGGACLNYGVRQNHSGRDCR